MPKRDCGHDFAYGFFYVDDDGTHVFEGRNPTRYAELREEEREYLQPEVAIVADLVRQGKSWSDIYDERKLLNECPSYPRPVPLRARIMRKWFLGWARPELIKELGVKDPSYPKDCRYRDECPQAHKGRKGWDDMSICDEYRGKCPRWPEDVTVQ